MKTPDPMFFAFIGGKRYDYHHMDCARKKASESLCGFYDAPSPQNQPCWGVILGAACYPSKEMAGHGVQPEMVDRDVSAMPRKEAEDKDRKLRCMQEHFKTLADKQTALIYDLNDALASTNQEITKGIKRVMELECKLNVAESLADASATRAKTRQEQVKELEALIAELEQQVAAQEQALGAVNRAFAEADRVGVGTARDPAFWVPRQQWHELKNAIQEATCGDQLPQSDAEESSPGDGLPISTQALLDHVHAALEKMEGRDIPVTELPEVIEAILLDAAQTRGKRLAEQLAEADREHREQMRKFWAGEPDAEQPPEVPSTLYEEIMDRLTRLEECVRNDQKGCCD